MHYNLKAMNKKEKISITMRLPKELIDRIAIIAKKQHRTKTSLVEFTLYEALGLDRSKDNSLGSAEEQPRAKGSRL